MLAEAIFSLFIVILMIFTLQNLLLSIKKVNMSESSRVNGLAYAYVQLNNFMHANETKTVYPVESNSEMSIFTRVDKNKKEETYKIEFYAKKQVLKVSKVGVQHKGGYMPLIFNIKSAKFKTKKDQIVIRIDENGKGKSDLVFQLDKKPNEKEDTEEKSTKNKGKRTT